MTMGLGGMAACSRAARETSAPIVVRDAWARPALAGGSGMVYFTIENADTLDLRVGTIVTPVAAATEVHETINAAGISQMVPRSDLVIVRGATIAMKPGGLHVMLVRLVRPLAEGDTIPLTLRFADGRTIGTTATVRDD